MRSKISYYIDSPFGINISSVDFYVIHNYTLPKVTVVLYKFDVNWVHLVSILSFNAFKDHKLRDIKTIIYHLSLYG